jgi:hypothetical protein
VSTKKATGSDQLRARVTNSIGLRDLLARHLQVVQRVATRDLVFRLSQQEVIHSEIWAASDGFLFDVGSAQPIGGDPPEEDTWYHLEMRIDWATRIATLSVDGTEILEGELEGTSNVIARIDLFTVEDATSYFDEIEVRP